MHVNPSTDAELLTETELQVQASCNLTNNTTIDDDDNDDDEKWYQFNIGIGPEL